MKSKVFFIVSIIMLIIAVGFIFFAFSNPQGSFPWSNAVTYTIYLFYIVIMVGFFILSREHQGLKGKVNKIKMFLLVASIVFAVLTFAGIGFVLFGQYNAGIAIVPMVFAISCITTYRRKYTTN